MAQPFSRRELLKMAGTAAASPLIPKPLFPSQEPLVPEGKGLYGSIPWINSLFRRGRPRTVTDPAHLKHIGMPVGGICCGQVYLGGEGRLWLWDIFGAPPAYPNITAGTHYEHPMEPASPFTFQAELLQHNDDEGVFTHPYAPGRRHPLSSEGFEVVRFEGKYPQAKVVYERKDLPLEIELEVVSPFIPLDEEDSGLPLVLLRYRLVNRRKDEFWGEVRIVFENPVGRFSGFLDHIQTLSREVKLSGWEGVVASGLPHRQVKPARPNIELSAWGDGTYGGWKSEGTAFGPGPVALDKLPERLSPANPKRRWFVNTHEARQGEDSPTADRHVGTLTRPPFKIERNFLNFRIGGGNHPGETCLNLLVDGKVVRTETGRDSSVLRGVSWDVREFEGSEGVLQIVDKHQGGWGHVSLDWPHLSDEKLPPDVPLERLPDFGSFVVLARGGTNTNVPHGPGGTNSVGQVIKLKPGETKTIDFLVAWHFPNYGEAHHEFRAIQDFGKLKRHYAKRFKDAAEVAKHFIQNEGRIVGDAEKWVETWYDSTLPYWFLERTLLSVGCLQTQTAHRFDNGRFYGWEGIYCCPGTCQHVWNYAQTVARLFPNLERDIRERVDYGISFQPDGTIWYRGESHKQIAHDGQAGTILRTYREHSTSPDDKFLRRVWPKVKRAIQRLIADDKSRDGILDGWQYNTLDSGWYGEISWISSLYLAALQAGRAMALEMSDAEFAQELDAILEKGKQNLPQRLFNGEYFIQRRDPAHLEAPGSGIGCHIDQVFGDSMLHQIGLEPVLDREKVKKALASLWKYNFTPDAGDYREKIAKFIPGGRWYAMKGEAGLLMTTFPKGGVEEAPGKGNPTWMVGYFNECMNGFEYQAAAHMIAEGMVAEGLAIVKSLDDRYHESKRNPYNEIECSDHYSRSMAAYGCFLTLCGFAYHGPSGRMRFAPQIQRSDFRAAFTAAKGWGTFSQKWGKGMDIELELKWGRLTLKELELIMPSIMLPETLKVTAAGKAVKAKLVQGRYMSTVAFDQPVTITAGSKVTVCCHYVV